jgi:hypothetical protein
VGVAFILGCFEGRGRWAVGPAVGSAGPILLRRVLMWPTTFFFQQMNLFS